MLNCQLSLYFFSYFPESKKGQMKISSLCWKGYIEYNPADLFPWWFCCIWNFYVTIQLNRLQHTPTLLPSSHIDIISNHCFLFVNTGQRGLERNTMSSREGQDLSTIHGTSMASVQRLKLGNLHNIQTMVMATVCRYKLSNSFWIQRLWSSGMWHDKVWQTCTGLRGTFYLHLQGNVGGTLCTKLQCQIFWRP
jgi:hypothetical protein